jgi:hypothetical protein
LLMFLLEEFLTVRTKKQDLLVPSSKKAKKYDQP